MIEDYSGRRYEAQKISEYQKTCSRSSEHEDACSKAIQSPLFTNCLDSVSLDTDTLLQRCIHDSCLGDETPCLATECLETPCRGTCKIDLYPKSPVCQLIWQLAETCRSWGMFLPMSWRQSFECKDTTTVKPTCGFAGQM